MTKTAVKEIESICEEVKNDVAPDMGWMGRSPGKDEYIASMSDFLFWRLTEEASPEVLTYYENLTHEEQAELIGRTYFG